MIIPKVVETLNLSLKELYSEIYIKENELFNLRIKQLTKKSLKSPKIKFVRRQIKHLKNLVTLRINNGIVISQLRKICK